MLKHFAFAPGYKNMNHGKLHHLLLSPSITPPGSYGAYPVAIRKKADELRDQWDARPCPFTRFEHPKLLDESRRALADFLNVPISTVVFVPNATTGVNTVLRNIAWNQDGKDEILQLNIIYHACANTTNYICEVANDLVTTRTINLHFPVEEQDLLSAFKSAIHTSRSSGHRPRLAIFDTIASIPGLRLPFEALTQICRSENILSLIDAAHGIGHIHLDLPSLDPDFFISNCHKWLFTPRSCALFYVPLRNQPIIRSPIPTSHGFVPRSASQNLTPDPDPDLDSNQKSDFVHNFEFVGTADTIAYLTVPEAIKWRREVCGGEENIRSYCTTLVNKGGNRVAEILGTVVLDNSAQTFTKCCFANIRLPLSLGETPARGDSDRKIKPRPGIEDAVVDWTQRTLVAEYGTYIQMFFFQDSWWIRLSGQVYLDYSDFEWTGEVLKEVCDKVALEFG